MIENSDAEQIERLNSRVVELLRERDALVGALQLIAGMSDDSFARNVAENILTALGFPIKGERA